jgi:hypothetical protein
MTRSEPRNVEMVGWKKFKRHFTGRVDVMPVRCEGWRRVKMKSRVLARTTKCRSFYKLSSWLWKDWLWEWIRWTYTSAVSPCKPTPPVWQAARPVLTLLPSLSQHCPCLKLRLSFSGFFQPKLSPSILTYCQPPHLSRLISSSICSARISLRLKLSKMVWPQYFYDI